MTEAEGRSRVVAEAYSWRKTPYHHNALLKGVGVDCAMFIIGVFRGAGIVEIADPKAYSAQWFLHRDEERFLAEILKYAHEITEPKPGDLVVYKQARTYSHGGIVVDPGWPSIIHASGRARMVIEADGDSEELAGRERKFFSHW